MSITQSRQADSTEKVSPDEDSPRGDSPDENSSHENPPHGDSPHGGNWPSAVATNGVAPAELEGRVLARRYRLVEPLGEGGMGSVWKARHLELGTTVAIKLMSRETACSLGLSRFKQEAQAAASLRSPHIVQVFDFGAEGDLPYIVMELLKGETLRDRLLRVEQLSIEETARILVQVARGLAKAHETGIIHRDLKPDNIFLTSDDDQDTAKVLDFGIAKRTDGVTPLTNSVTTRSGIVLGTPWYMSPEQARDHTLDHRTDIWSLGVIAFECVVGRRLFQAESLGDLLLAVCSDSLPIPSGLVDCPLAFDEWFARCTERDPSNRFQSMRQASQALAAVAEGAVSARHHSLGSATVSASQPPPHTPTPSLAAPPSGRPATTDEGGKRESPLSMVIAVAAGGGLVIGFGVGALIWLDPPDSPHARPMEPVVSTASSLPPPPSEEHPTTASSETKPPETAPPLDSTTRNQQPDPSALSASRAGEPTTPVGGSRAGRRASTPSTPAPRQPANSEDDWLGF